ncbi:transcriptional regulator [Mycobacterium sp. MFM001]|uniref:helix-turn-helix transcriptional regulator n=1 Tax=Mycobacterium sp. MFM001 TaxID=2049453 RepID=UPI000DA44860|nr:helix-turn-helix domain-containing protein [Mycobacterium sp. MFM001]GBE65905.1 transcriptional regulator [Mycobacterium sp. MFM001]
MSAIKEPVGRRRDVLRVLKAAAAPMSIVAIADELGVHPNTVRFHLDSLLGDGQVEQVRPERKGPGRPALMFRATRQMDRGGPRRYRLLAEILAMGFAADRDPGAKALAAGRAWGRQLEPPRRTKESVEHLVDVLDELGFAPERRGRKQLGLRHCPFLEMAEARQSVVCPIHLGLMQGALENWSAPVTVERLDAFAEPDLCMAHLGAAR